MKLTCDTQILVAILQSGPRQHRPQRDMHRPMPVPFPYKFASEQHICVCSFSERLITGTLVYYIMLLFNRLIQERTLEES